VVPGQLTNEASAVADVLVNTVRVAQLVTLVQKPLTWTQYVPASVDATDGIEKELLVAPVMAEPFWVHW
jgi:hypothetical protein